MWARGASVSMAKGVEPYVEVFRLTSSQADLKLFLGLGKPRGFVFGPWPNSKLTIASYLSVASWCLGTFPHVEGVCLLKFTLSHSIFRDLPGDARDKESTCSAGDTVLIPAMRKSPGGGEGNPPQYSCLENPHGQRSLVGYSLWGGKESDTAERLSTEKPSMEVKLNNLCIIN